MARIHDRLRADGRGTSRVLWIIRTHADAGNLQADILLRSCSLKPFRLRLDRKSAGLRYRILDVAAATPPVRCLASTLASSGSLRKLFKEQLLKAGTHLADRSANRRQIASLDRKHSGQTDSDLRSF